MKKIILYPLILIFSLILIVLGILFVRPDLVINTKNLKWALQKQSILKDWSWSDAQIHIDWKTWNNRHIYGGFKDFCFQVDAESVHVQTCIDEMSWDFNLLFEFASGFSVIQDKPLILISKKLLINPKEVIKEKKAFESIDVWSYWEMLWSAVIPNLSIDLSHIEIKDVKEVLNLELHKDKNHLRAQSFNFVLEADPKGFAIRPPATFRLPIDPVLGHKLHLYNFMLNALVFKDHMGIDISGKLEAIDINVTSKLKLPIDQDPALAQFRREFLSSVVGKISLKQLNKTYQKYSPAEFPILPAPLNVMEGDFVTDFNIDISETSEIVDLKTKSVFDLRSTDQILKISFDGLVPLNVLSFKPDAVTVGVDFHELALKLPRLSKTSLPPQFKPDSRFITKKENKKVSAPKSEPLNLNLKLEALNEKAFQLKTNLLDEVLKANFDINILNSELKKSFIRILPLKTTVFKRPIHVDFLKIDFIPPLESVITGTVFFPLPTYKIKLELEGPISNPRYTFSSEPPLPKNDIYAVLLFGRPISDLDPDDKNAAQKTNQILSQGLLSLSVLYFLAGSPVEYIGYDAESKNASASIGINSKTSLRVEGSGQGVNSTGLRRSLGKGWYIDTSVEKTQGSAQEARSYGVMLERIIAY